MDLGEAQGVHLGDINEHYVLGEVFLAAASYPSSHNKAELNSDLLHLPGACRRQGPRSR